MSRKRKEFLATRIHSINLQKKKKKKKLYEIAEKFIIVLAKLSNKYTDRNTFTFAVWKVEFIRSERKVRNNKNSRTIKIQCISIEIHLIQLPQWNSIPTNKHFIRPVTCDYLQTVGHVHTCSPSRDNLYQALHSILNQRTSRSHRANISSLNKSDRKYLHGVENLLFSWKQISPSRPAFNEEILLRSSRKSGANWRWSMRYQRPRAAPMSDFIVFHIQSNETDSGE